MPCRKMPAVSSVTHWLEPLLPTPRDTRQCLDLHNPFKFVIAVMLSLTSPNHGLRLSKVLTNMEAAGLEGVHVSHEIL